MIKRSSLSVQKKGNCVELAFSFFCPSFGQISKTTEFKNVISSVIAQMLHVNLHEIGRCEFHESHRIQFSNGRMNT
ncbi:hypothetical protein DERF_007094 [Dermatophagoides farinae]|uniref:Uncharacterized protein n=1 Tax=Dermatophagoides farinae TaxID=6954 RepID=A0A922I0D1_DERFA|nr:hypothetical protein DERF_007094 [Dermatophagoides farinae]